MMETSIDSDFTTKELKNDPLNDSGLTEEIEDGELVEDVNVSEEDKKILRAKRFGPVSNVSKPKIQDPKLLRLYRRMKVNNDTRLEALHLHGTDMLKTEDIFALFSGYLPASVEWLTDKTCNAVWLDQESCAKALKNCSTRIKDQNGEDSEDSEEEYINREDIRCALPPGWIWRRSHATQLAPNLFIRFASYSDRRGSKPIHFQQGGDPLRRNFVFLDEGDEVARKFRADSGNPWVDIAREWSYYEMKSAAKKHDDHRLPVRDARELISNVGRVPPMLGPSTGTGESYKILKNRATFLDEGLEDDEGTELRVPTDRIILGRKMQADLEEKRILSKRLFRSRINRSPSHIDLRQRLSEKRSKQLVDSFSENDSVERFKDFKHDRFRRKRHIEETTWTRGETDDSDSEEEAEEEEEEDREQFVIRNSTSSSSTSSSSRSSSSSASISSREDLRKKLRKHSSSSTRSSCEKKLNKKKSSVVVLTQNTKKFIPDTPLQIEIDNDIYFERVNRK